MRKKDPVLLGSLLQLNEKNVKKAFTRFSVNKNYKNDIIITEPWELIREHCEICSINEMDIIKLINFTIELCDKNESILEENPRKVSACIIHLLFSIDYKFICDKIDISYTSFLDIKKKLIPLLTEN